MTFPTVGSAGQSVSSIQTGNSQIDQNSNEQKTQGFFGRLGQCVRVVADAITYIPRKTMGLIWGSTQPVVDNQNEPAVQASGQQRNPPLAVKDRAVSQDADICFEGTHSEEAILKDEDQNEPADETENMLATQAVDEKLNESDIPEDFGASFDHVCRYGSIDPSLSLRRKHYEEGEKSQAYRSALSATNYLKRKKFAATENKEAISHWDKFKAGCKSLKDRIITVLNTVYKKIIPLKVRIAFRKLSDKISTSDYNLFKIRAAAKDLKDAKEALRCRAKNMGPLYSAVVQRAREIQKAEPVEGKTPYERIDNTVCVGKDKALDYNNEDAITALEAAEQIESKTPIELLEEKLKIKNADQLEDMYMKYTTEEDEKAHKANRKENEKVNFLMKDGKKAYFYDYDPEKNKDAKLLARKKAKKLDALKARRSS